MQFSIVALLAAVSLVSATPFPDGGKGGRQPPSCGGNQARCCTGSYQASGELVNNCITYTPQQSVCSVDSNVYCCETCIDAIGSCVACVHYY